MHSNMYKKTTKLHTVPELTRKIFQWEEIGFDKVLRLKQKLNRKPKTKSHSCLGIKEVIPWECGTFSSVELASQL